jgi:multiple sugar transport system substrate-binding protein
MTRREFLRASALGASGLILARCAPAATLTEVPTVPPTAVPATEVPMPPPTQGPVTIKFWRYFTPSGDKIIKELVEDFKKVEPLITVEFEAIPDSEYEQRVMVSTAAGNPPDTFQIYSQTYGLYSKRGALAPVMPEAFGYKTASEMLQKHFMPGTMDFAFRDGKLYSGGMTDISNWGLAYNLDCFDKVKEPYLAEDKILSWDEYFSLARRLTLRDGAGKITQMGDGMWVTAQDNPVGCFIILDPLFKQMGGECFDEVSGKPLNKDIWLKLATMMYDCTLKGKYGYVDMGFPTSTNAHPELFNGRIAVTQAGIWAEGWGLSVNPKLRIGFAPLPAIPGSNQAAIVYGWLLVTAAKSSPEKQDAGWKWINFLSNKDNIYKWYDEGGEVAPRNVPGFAEHLVEAKPAMKMFLELSKRGKPATFGDKGTEHWDVMRKMTEAIFKSGVEPQAAVDQAWTAMEAIG